MRSPLKHTIHIIDSNKRNDNGAKLGLCGYLYMPAPKGFTGFLINCKECFSAFEANQEKR